MSQPKYGDVPPGARPYPKFGDAEANLACKRCGSAYMILEHSPSILGSWCWDCELPICTACAIVSHNDYCSIKCVEKNEIQCPGCDQAAERTRCFQCEQPNPRTFSCYSDGCPAREIEFCSKDCETAYEVVEACKQATVQ